MRFFLITIRSLMISSLIVSSLWMPAFADDEIRDLIREPDDKEHVIIFVTGWQLADLCVFGGLVSPDTGVSLCSVSYNPASTWREFQEHFNAPNPDEILAGHRLTFPSYPTRDDSKILYYSYTGDYSYILDSDNDGEIEDVQGACEPNEQLDLPDDAELDGYRCLPDYTKADTSIFLQLVDGELFWDGLYSNLTEEFADLDNLEQYAKLIVEQFLRPLNPGVEAAQLELTSRIIKESVQRTFEEYGVYDLGDLAPQRALFNTRAEHLQDLIDSVVLRYQQDGKDVEITIVGHSQGGLVATYWAGWEGNDAANVNAVITLDSPLGRTISLLGISETWLKDIPRFTTSIEIPPASLPFLGEIFPGSTINIDVGIDEYVRSELSKIRAKIFWGMDDVIDNAPSQTPIYTVRNMKDLFVTADFAWLGQARAWHDKLVDFDGERGTANHIFVSKERAISRDIQYVTVGGSIFAPNRDLPSILFTDSLTNQRLQIDMASPAFIPLRGQQPSVTDFTVELLPSGSVHAAYTLDVIGVVQGRLWNYSTPAERTAPPLTLTTVFPEQVAPGTYDLRVQYQNFATETTALAREAVVVDGETELSNSSIILVIDRSGSMAQSLENGEVKIDAVKNAASFLAQVSSIEPQNRLGVLAFNNDNQKIFPQSGPLVEVTSDNLSAYIDSIGSINASGGTRLTEALVNARNWMDEGDIAHRAKAIVALTDGASADNWATNFVDVPVYTIGFGEGSPSWNPEELTLIAQETGGVYANAPSEAELRLLYDRIQRQVSGSNGLIQLEKSISPDSTDTVEFTVDPTIERFRLAINWDATEISSVGLRLITPGGTEIDDGNFDTSLPGSKLFSTNGSWLFSTNDPEDGTWKLIITGAQIVGVEGLLDITSASSTPVRLEVASQPGLLTLGESLQTVIALTNLDPIWTILNVVDAEATATLPSGQKVEIDMFDDGFHGDGTANDFIFTAVIPDRFVNELGSYVIDVVVRGLLANRETGEVFASANEQELSFERVFTAIRQVDTLPNRDLTANLTSMIVAKPGESGEYCLTYANRGPGNAADVGLFVASDNAIYASATEDATRGLEGFSVGWQLGQLPSGASGNILVSMVSLDVDEPVELTSWIADGVFANKLESATIDSLASDNTSLSPSEEAVHQLDAGWTLLGLKRQPSVVVPSAILCAIDGPIDVALGFEYSGMTYDPEVPEHINTLEAMDALHGYWIRTDSPRTLAISGLEIPVDTPIELHAGWNLVNFLPANVQQVSNALSSIAGQYDAVLGYDQGATSFYTRIPPQLSTLNALEPGKAYWIHMLRASTLVYHDETSPDASGAALLSLNQPQRPRGVTPSNQWVNFYSEAVIVDGKPAPVGTTVEAYTRDGIKIGETQVVEPGIMQLLTAYGDDVYTPSKDGANWGEQVTFLISGVPATVYSEPDSAIWQGHGELIPLRIGIEPNLPNKVYMPFINR